MAGAALAGAWIGLPGLAFPPVALGIVLAWGWHLTQVLQRGTSAMRTLELNATGGVRCQDGLGQWHQARILPGSYVSGWLMVVILGVDGRRSRSLVLLPDSAAAEELRRLRAWLRWRHERP
jgi:toxin CptA